MGKEFTINEIYRLYNNGTETLKIMITNNFIFHDTLKIKEIEKKCIENILSGKSTLGASDYMKI